MRTRAASLFITIALCAAPLLAQESAAPEKRIRVGGFLDATTAYATESGNTYLDSAELDLFLNARLTDRWSFVGEGLLQRLPRGVEIEENVSRKSEADIERFYVAYDPSDRFRLELGQTHTGISDWNERYHRGRFLQTTIDIPAIADREEQGGAWPLHFFGVWASGRLPGSLGLQYGAGVGKARASERDQIAPVRDRRTTFADLVSLRIAPDRFPGFEAGGAVYIGSIPAPQGKMHERDETLFASYVRGPIEVRGEWARMRHHEVNGGPTHVTSGWYSLVSWRPHGRFRIVRPYVLVDHLNVAHDEPYLADVIDRDAISVGLRWDLNRWFNVKSDVHFPQAKDGSGRRQTIRMQLGFAF